MQQSQDEWEIAGDAQREQESSHEVLRLRIRVDHLRRSDSPVVVDDPIEDEVEDSPHHPVDADLIDPVLVNVVVAAPEALVVNHGEHRKADIRQHKEVADAASEGSLFLPHIVKVEDRKSTRLNSSH